MPKRVAAVSTSFHVSCVNGARWVLGGGAVTAGAGFGGAVRGDSLPMRTPIGRARVGAALGVGSGVEAGLSAARVAAAGAAAERSGALLPGAGLDFRCTTRFAELALRLAVDFGLLLAARVALRAVVFFATRFAVFFATRRLVVVFAPRFATRAVVFFATRFALRAAVFFAPRFADFAVRFAVVFFVVRRVVFFAPRFAARFAGFAMRFVVVFLAVRWVAFLATCLAVFFFAVRLADFFATRFAGFAVRFAVFFAGFFATRFAVVFVAVRLAVFFFAAFFLLPVGCAVVLRTLRLDLVVAARRDGVFFMADPGGKQHKAVALNVAEGNRKTVDSRTLSRRSGAPGLGAPRQVPEQAHPIRRCSPMIHCAPIDEAGHPARRGCSALAT